MNKQILLLALSILILSTSTVAVAKTAYVSDQLTINLRRGEGNGFKIRRSLKSGERITVVSENAASGYSKVITSGKTEGYVLTRFLMDQPSVRDQLVSVTARNSKLQEKITQLESEITRLDDLEKQQGKEIRSLNNGKNKVQKDLSTLQKATQNVRAINDKNARLTQEVISLRGERDVLERDNRAYRDNTKQDWFIRGGAVLLLGILIGFVLPMLRRRRRWGEL